MLLWKKYKFELLVEVLLWQVFKFKGYVVSLYYLVFSFLVWVCFEGVFSWVGSMFCFKCKKLYIISEDLIYIVFYLGNVIIIQVCGDGCIDFVVGKIWSKSEVGCQGIKMKLIVSVQGICMVYVEECVLCCLGYFYLLYCVIYCVVDVWLFKVFVWVYWYELKYKVVMLCCYVVLVFKFEKVQVMVLLFYQMLVNVLVEFKCFKWWDDVCYQQQELVGVYIILLVLFCKLFLYGFCCYKLLVECSCSVFKFGFIIEDLFGE